MQKHKTTKTKAQKGSQNEQQQFSQQYVLTLIVPQLSISKVAMRLVLALRNSTPQPKILLSGKRTPSALTVTKKNFQN